MFLQCAHHIKNFNVKLFANADAAAAANADAGGSTIALPGLCPGELKMDVLDRMVTRFSRHYAATF